MLTRVLFALAAMTGPAAALELSVPIACTPGVDCFVQQYVDRDKGPGVRDYACGAETYDGHKGADIRLRTTAEVAKGVGVLASAPGTVIGARDGMADHLVRTDADRAGVAALECGNGVRIDHGEGWITQYCHMRKGSIAVKKGDEVKLGAKLGEVGYSGQAAFAHVHIEVTKDGKVIDPFLPEPEAACGKAENSLWTESARAALAYQPGTLLGLGFADHPLSVEELESGAVLVAPSTESPMVAYAWAINLREGDKLEVSLVKDRAPLAENSVTLDRGKAQYMLFAGKKRPPGGWTSGTYTAVVKILRDGKPVIDETRTFDLD
jgi:hypothetical protein